ncbi:MAG: carboxymuconolactone decarboxylase family protein [Glaciihabitans sp.]|nr:carboxymuconolactone decarboxylase family protein [Glaciihabitans sp.]
MAIIHTVPEAEATGHLAELYAEDIEDQGFVAAHTKVIGLNPDSLAAFEQLIRAVALPLGKRRYELVTLAAALGVRSRQCRLAHGRRTLTFMDEDELVRIAHDYHNAGLSEAEVVMMEFAEKVSGDSSAMTDADSLRLREVGFSDAEIVDIALAAAARNYYSRAVHALAIEVEYPDDISERLRSELVAGI